MTGCHHRCNEHELGQTLEDGEGQGSLVCCSSWSRRVRHDWETKQHHHFNSTMYSPGIFSNVYRHFWSPQHPEIHRAAPDNKELSGPSQEFRG